MWEWTGRFCLYSVVGTQLLVDYSQSVVKVGALVNQTVASTYR